MKNILYLLLLINLSAYSQKISRDPSAKDYANVFYKSKYTLFDLLTDKPIFPNSKGDYNIYYASNEEPTPKHFVVTSSQLSNMLYYKFANYTNCKAWCDKKNSSSRSSTNSTTTNDNYSSGRSRNNSQKFCHDDTYGYSGMKLEITLNDDGSARLDYKSDGIIKRSGSAKWRETSGMAEGYGENGIIYLFLSTGASLKFEAIKNSWGKTYMLIDSRDNQYMECF